MSKLLLSFVISIIVIDLSIQGNSLRNLQKQDNSTNSTNNNSTSNNTTNNNSTSNNTTNNNSTNNNTTNNNTTNNNTTNNNTTNNNTTNNNTTNNNTTNNNTTNNNSTNNNSTNNNSSQVILLGFDDFEKVNNTFFKFKVNLKRIGTNINIKTINVPIIINYKNRLRLLKEDKNNLVCNCDDSNENVECNCEGECKNKNISNIELAGDIQIDGKNITLSSLAEEQKTKIDKQKDDIFNKDDIIEVMSEAELIDHSSNFIIKGTLDNKDFPSSDEFKLTATKYNKQKEFLCEGSFNSSDYVLDCDNPNIVNNLDLNNTLAQTNGNEKLIIQFPTGVQSKIGASSNSGGFYRSNKKKGLSTGGIIAIIIPSVIVLLGALALAFMLNRNPSSPPLINNNTIGISSSTNINEKNII